MLDVAIIGAGPVGATVAALAAASRACRSRSSRRAPDHRTTGARSRFRTRAASSSRRRARGPRRPPHRSHSIHVSQKGGPGPHADRGGASRACPRSATPLPTRALESALGVAARARPASRCAYGEACEAIALDARCRARCASLRDARSQARAAGARRRRRQLREDSRHRVRRRRTTGSRR